MKHFNLLRKLFAILLFTISLSLLTSHSLFGQSFTIGNVSSMCLDDGSAEVFLDNIPEPVTVSWYNEYLDETHTGIHPTNLKDGQYFVTVTDANGDTYTNYTYIGAEVYWFPAWPLPTAPCPGGTTSAEIYIEAGDLPASVYINDVLDGVATDNSYQTSQLGIGSHTCYVIDNNGCRSAYAGQETDSSSIGVQGVTDLDITISWIEESCGGPYTVSYDITTESAPPYVNYWRYWNGVEMVTDYSTDLTGIPNATNVSLVSTDANGCEMTFSTNISEPNVIQAYGTPIPATCPNDDGSINMTVFGGTAPYTFEWNNGETSEDLSNLAFGNYTLTATDSEGCSNSFTKHVGLNSTVFVSGSVTPPNCEENIPGNINSTVSGGVSPYTFEWSNGESTEDLSFDQFGYYSLTVTDSEGCIDGRSFYIPISDPCYAYVNGTTYYDLDGNCSANGTDFAMSSYVHSTNGNYAMNYGYNWGNGQYQRRFLNDVTLTANSNGYDLICPATDVALNFAANTTYDDVDFYLQPSAIEDDLCVNQWSWAARPGFGHNGVISISNPGTTILDTEVKMEYTPVINFTNSFPAPTTIDTDLGVVTWNLTNVLPNSTQQINLYYHTDASVELGEEITYSVSLDGGFTDINPANNTYSYTTEVVGSYDPNDKRVFPSGTGETHMIDPLTEQLEFMVRFQNTGTYLAENVVIQDEIDSDKIDLNKIEVLDASHTITDVTLDGNRLYIAFEGINLPDSTSNLEGSQGYVTFRTGLVEGLSLGTVVENTAAIYFDFNQPIITNTAFVTLDVESSVLENQRDESLKIFPNPSTGIITISSDLGLDQVQLVDLSGRIVWEKSNSGVATQMQLIIPTAISNGVYLVQTTSGTVVTQSELILMK